MKNSNLSFCEFSDQFHKMNRQDNFSYKGLQALYDYLEEYEESTGEDVELDVIALCCDYSEYKNLKELQENYTDIESIDDLENNTIVIPLSGNPEEDGFIIQQY